MSDAEEILGDISASKEEESPEEPFNVEETGHGLGSSELEVPSSVLLVDQAGNVLGDLSMTLDPSQMPVFITHVAKASDCTNETRESIIELSEVNPAPKRKRKDYEDDATFNFKNWFTNFQKKVNDCLKVLDEKASALDVHCQLLRQKTHNLATQVSRMSKSNVSGKGRNGTIIVGLPPSNSSDNVFPIISNVYSHTSAYQLMAHNSEDEFPDGSWLGDPDNPEFRVRCPIAGKDLDYILKMCPTGEKMALTLLDYLFDRETQACSNISGNSKHGKKQLDPLKIYGIKCHIMHHFGVDEAAWQKIKLNLDSKCRTAFRRKLKGMPLTVKAFKDGRNGVTSLLSSNPSEDQDTNSKDDDDEGDEEEALSRLTPLEEEEQVPVQKVTARLTSTQRLYNKVQPRLLPKMCLEEEELEDESATVLSLTEGENNEEIEEDGTSVTVHPGEIALSLPLSQLYGEPQVLFASQNSQLIQTEQGDFQLLQATPEQLAQIQAGHPVQILTTAAAHDSAQMDSCQDPC